MKKILIVFAAAVLVLTGCAKQGDRSVFAPSDATRTITFAASGSDVRTSISGTDGTGYTMKWEPGDRIDIFEIAAGEIVRYVSRPLSYTDIANDGTAFFTVEVAARTASEYQYIGVYPHTSYEEGWDYESFCAMSEDFYGNFENWAYAWKYTSQEQVVSHPVLMMELPFRQSPTFAGFDPASDAMVSEIIKRESLVTPSEPLPLKFARVGSILKIKLGDIPVPDGTIIKSATFSFGDSYGGNLNAEYDTYLQKYQYYKGFPRFELTPQNLTVVDGKAELWLRCYAGEITDWFELRIDFGGSDVKGMVNGYTCHVNLAAEKRSIVIADGKMTELTIGTWAVPDVPNVPYDGISVKVNETLNGFTATWDYVPNAVGYKCVLTSWDDPSLSETVSATENMDGTWSATISGLSPAEYCVTIIPEPEAGHALMDDGYGSQIIRVGIPTTAYIYYSMFNDRFDVARGVTYDYDYDGVKLKYKDCYNGGYGYLDFDLDDPGMFYNEEAFCNKMVSLIVYQQGPDPMCRVYAGVAKDSMTEVAPEVKEAVGGSYLYSHQIAFSFPEGTKYFIVKGRVVKISGGGDTCDLRGSYALLNLYR